MSQVTIEGSAITPSTFLPAGERRTVERTDFVEKLIAKGYVTVIEGDSPDKAERPARGRKMTRDKEDDAEQG